MSTILCVIDGMTDPAFRPADLPVLSSFDFREYVSTTPAGYETESLNCILTLLGASGFSHCLRGYADALGAGIRVKAGDLVTRVSWLAVDGEGRCSVPADVPDTVHVPAGCAYHSLGGYKGLLLISGQGDCAEALTTCPPYECAGKAPVELRPAGSASLGAFFDANVTAVLCAVPWGQSAAAPLPPFGERAAVICGTQIVRGIAAMLGMTCPVIPGATGDVDTDLSGKTAAALESAKDFPFVLLHINGADEASHRKDAAEKAAFLQRVDALVLAQLRCCPHRVHVVSDHATDPATGRHVGTPQPLFFKKEEPSYGGKESLFFSALGL